MTQYEFIPYTTIKNQSILKNESNSNLYSSWDYSAGTYILILENAKEIDHKLSHRNRAPIDPALCVPYRNSPASNYACCSRIVRTGGRWEPSYPARWGADMITLYTFYRD